MRSESVSEPDFGRANWLVVALILLGVAIGLLPILFHFGAPTSSRIGAIFAYLPAILAAILCYSLDKTIAKKEKIDTLLLCVVLAFLTTYLHVWLVDLNSYFQGHTNLEWQLYMQQSVLNLSPDTLPHSYRFLPNSIVRLFEQVSGDFPAARDGYRNLFTVLFFYGFYRFARLYLRHGGSLVCLALLAVVLPVSFRYYAGQLTDPLSHLSFILAFIFIETEQFVYLLLAVTIGCLAKETVIAMAGYYVLFRWREKAYIWRAAILLVASFAVYELARIWVLHGLPTYRQISGVGSEHIAQNWDGYSEWFPGLVYTVGVFVPFVILGWGKSPWALRSLAIYWFPVLFVSGLVFSWLREARNFVPLSAILIVLTVYYLAPAERAESIGGRIAIGPGVRHPGPVRSGPRKVKPR